MPHKRTEEAARSVDDLPDRLGYAFGWDLSSGLPMRRLVAEFGLRSFQSLTEWAWWAIERIDQTDGTRTADPEAPAQG
jgi:hypothetical protein